MTKFLLIEGGDGAGTSTHADVLAACLCARNIDAVAWHHPQHPDGAEGLARVVHYERSRVWARDWRDPREMHSVYVFDRGPWSGLAYARSLEAADVRRLDSGHHVAAMEIALWWQDTPVAYLDAADATLDARLLLRGEDPAASHGERAQWRRLADAEGWPVVSTDRPRADVAADLLALALGVLA